MEGALSLAITPLCVVRGWVHCYCCCKILTHLFSGFSGQWEQAWLQVTLHNKGTQDIHRRRHLVMINRNHSMVGTQVEFLIPNHFTKCYYWHKTAWNVNLKEGTYFCLHRITDAHRPFSWYHSPTYVSAFWKMIEIIKYKCVQYVSTNMSFLALSVLIFLEIYKF